MGFYDWRRDGNRTVPVWISPKEKRAVRFGRLVGFVAKVMC